ncbi:MAG TPA: NapC/NirT family cytochrome c [Candidatus Nitrosotalea sp.]|nr:NapC/NirT family cytochrome c [Candidatus Nitrosotalea sp.]
MAPDLAKRIRDVSRTIQLVGVAVKRPAWAAALVVLLASAAAQAAEDSVPLPHGWIGTTSDWVRGFGIAFALLNLALLVFAWRGLRHGITPTSRGWLFVAVGLVPLMVAFLSFAHGLEESATVSACGSCHVMTPFVQDLQNVKSDTLAATHFKNRYIRENQCYTCHSNYGLGGTIKAKFEGLGHVWRYAVGAYTLPINLAQPYPNVRCLGCHGASQKFQNAAGHPKEDMHSLLDGTVSCIGCHGPAHPEQKKAASR